MKKILLLVLNLCFAHFLFSQFSNNQQLREDVEFLASDELEGRMTGTESELNAANYIQTRFEKLKLKPLGNSGSYLQEFKVEPKANPHMETVENSGKPVKVTNVIAYLDNDAPYTVVIGAHYDHLGYGGAGSLYVGEKEIHNGADDNASGVAVLLNLAESISNSVDLKNQNYLFIAFSGEEQGLWGSNYFCKNPTIDLQQVNYMINMDMVGRFDESKGLAINGVGTSPSWTDLLTSANTSKLKIISSESGVGPSDHTSFYLQDIPVLHFFTGQHEDYHKPSDDVEHLNIEGMELVHDFIYNILASTSNMEKLTFTKTKDESESTPKFTVTLGVMPDYLFQGEGMRIDGVSDGKPAKIAGFEKGDIVIKMGDVLVSDMMSYMKGLSMFKKGESTEVTVKRGDKQITSKVVF